MTQDQNHVSRRDFVKGAGTIGGLAALSAVGLSGVSGSAQGLEAGPLEGIRFTFGQATPNSHAQYMASGHLEDAERNVIPHSGFSLTAEREVDAAGVEVATDPGNLYAGIANTEGARYIQICYVVYYSVLQQVETSDGTRRTFFTRKTYQTDGMVPMTIDLAAPRPDGNLFEFVYTTDENAPGNGGTSPDP